MYKEAKRVLEKIVKCGNAIDISFTFHYLRRMFATVESLDILGYAPLPLPFFN